MFLGFAGLDAAVDILQIGHLYDMIRPYRDRLRLFYAFARSDSVDEKISPGPLSTKRMQVGEIMHLCKLSL